MNRQSRIILITMATLLCCAGVAFAGGQTQTPAAATATVSGRYSEAPSLAAAVARGELPPVAERLPDEPLVVTPFDEVGTYGGTLRRVWRGPADSVGLMKLIPDAYAAWGTDGQVFPNLAKGWEMAPDGKALTMFLRPGVRWSDGEPFTSEVARFYWEDWLKNDSIVVNKPAWSRNVDRVVIVDDYTFRVEFNQAAAYSFLHSQMTSIGNVFLMPAHYLKQFHPAYTPQATVDRLAREAGFNSWVELIAARERIHLNKDRPTLSAWIAVNDPTDPVFRHERNPYYFKVDSAGNQLPYIDRIEHSFIESNEVMVLKAIQGEIDMQFRHFALADFPVMKENEDPARFEVFLAPRAIGATGYFLLSLNSVDPVKAAAFRDRRFRQALSLAINRDEINEVNYLGLGDPRQASWVPESPFYDEAWARAFAEYDPQRARRLLDEIGFRRDAQGFILRSDNNQRFTLFIDHFGGFGTTPDFELIEIYYEAIGINTEIRQMDRALFQERSNTGELDMTTWPYDRVDRPDLQWDQWAGTMHAFRWRQHFDTNGAQGEEPTDPSLVKLWQLRNELLVTVNESRRAAIMREAAAIHAQEVYAIGWVGSVPIPGPINARMRNLPREHFVYANAYGDDGFVFPFQLYYRN